MTTPEEPTTADRMRSIEDVPQELVWDRIRNVDRDWSPESERERAASEPAHVLVPFDDSGPARDALEYALELFPDADVTALQIVDDSTISYIPPPSNGPTSTPTGQLLQAVPRELEHALEIADDFDREIRTAGRVGSPTQEILAYLADESVDHVVIGSHSRSGLARVLWGSVAETVVRHSPVPVTVIPTPSNEDD